jgi:hypothetical protein
VITPFLTYSSISGFAICLRKSSFTELKTPLVYEEVLELYKLFNTVDASRVERLPTRCDQVLEFVDTRFLRRFIH